MPFPRPDDLYLMAEVPAGGYSDSDAFDREYTAMLRLLHDAWATGNSQTLAAALVAMNVQLGSKALDLLDAGLPSGTGPGIKGPDFRFLNH